MSELYQEIKELERVRNTALSDYEKYGIEKSDKDRELDIAVQKQTLIRKEQGDAISTIKDLVKGDTADLRLARNIAEIKQKTAEMAHYNAKQDIDTRKLQMNMEWNSL